MLPVLFKIGPIPIYSFGVFLTLGVIGGMFVSWRKAREYHLEDDDFFDLVFSALLGGIILGRAWYIVENFSQFGTNVLKWLWFTHYVGISFIGALIGAAIAVVLISRRLDIELFKVLDLLSIGGSLGLSLAWLGAWLDGFPVGREIAGRSFPLHLVAIIGFFVLYRFLWWAERRYRTFEWYRAGKSSAKSGFLFGSFLLFLGLIHAILGGLLENPRNWLGLPQEVIFGLVTIIAGIILIYWRSGRRLKTDLSSIRRQKKKAF